MSISGAIVFVVSVLFIIFTFASLLRWNVWWIRIFDYPRIQISTVLILLILASFMFYRFSESWQFIVTGLLFASLFYQARKIYRYTMFVPKQVKTYKGSDIENAVSLIVSNVEQPNRNSEALITQVKKMNPDLLLVLEADDWWEKQLSIFEKDYPYTLLKPQDNLYGMLLYSKFELQNTKVKYLVKDRIPSFEAIVISKAGNRFRIYCLHPKPPFPTESPTSVNRDGELLLVGKKAKKENLPVIIFGDFNDVAWSNTTRLFQKVSELLDPRIGRGFFNTFHAKYLLMRWSLDHLFHSDHFQLIKIKRLKKIGSDHFPIYVRLYYKPSSQDQQDEPEADHEEEHWANEKIMEAEPK